MKLSVSSKAQPDVLGNPLDKLTAHLKNDLSAVNGLILERMQSEIPMIPQLAGHLIAAGGKRIRPLLTLASAALFGYKGTRQHKLSACVEFIHTATLLHDDVVDDSAQRRGRSSANALFGNEAAVLVGDFLFSRSFQLMVEDGSLDVLRILSTASAVIAEGEVLQLSTANDLETTEAQYLRVVRSKTAELFAAACEVGAVVAGGSPSECMAMRDYGMNLGIAFQISDDILDYSSSGTRLGKSVGDDFKEGKMTLPVIRAVAKADAAERRFWNRCMTDLRQEDGDFQEALALLRKHDALNSSLSEAGRYAELGKKALAGVPDHPLRGHFGGLIVFAVERDY
ncbi:MAG: polyprenyl synthetase family protein [Pseudomonadota bacterium]